MASKVTFNGELMFPNDYLSAPELKGADVKLTITAVTTEMLKKKGGKDKREMVMRFRGTKKKFVCNKTNADTIASMYGTKAEQWVNKQITVYPTRCLAFGEMVDCVRIREKNNGGAARLPDPPPPDSFGEPHDNAPDAGDGTDPVGFSSSESGDSSGAGADIGEGDDPQQPEPPPSDDANGLPNPCSTQQIKNLLMLQAPEGMDSQTAVTVIDAFFTTKLPKKWEQIQRPLQEKYFKKWMGGEFPPFNAM